ncbi:hypothetical protein [Actinopolyspora mortivallis]|uniref:hypothetical protein n=1 Tax=Actinopolyspora mortivallis TaxID=33906 RepID=UPI001FDFABAD|nr:hypothetical protein [Actinopolyspora mortivallis]
MHELTGNLSSTNDAMRGIITAADQGEFTITPDAGNELIEIFQDLEEWAENAQLDLITLRQRTPLGHSPAGKSIADFNQKVASGDNESYDRLIIKIRKNAPKTVEAIRKGIRLYQDIDENSATKIEGSARSDSCPP